MKRFTSTTTAPTQQKWGSFRLFFLGLDVNFKVLDITQDEAARQTVAAWQDVAEAGFPIVRIGEKNPRFVFQRQPQHAGAGLRAGRGRAADRRAGQRVQRRMVSRLPPLGELSDGGRCALHENGH